MKLFSLFNRKVFDIKSGLDRIRNALKDTGNLHRKYPSILISGTNGKGSTAAFLESLFRKHGFKTGLFTSPHLIEENERWQINRENISDLQLEEYIKELKPVIERYELSYFEASALIAFRYFADEDVNIAVLEVGLGGRWDATNVVYPEVSIITNVSLDHTHILGETTYEIAREKIGIARKDRPLVIGTQQIELISQAVINGIKEIYHYPVGFHYKIKTEAWTLLLRS
ncbi:MAG: Mur ligase family protein [Persephonella sp.]|nr:Mur ligase family protein [Persephonella sp.]